MKTKRFQEAVISATVSNQVRLMIHMQVNSLYTSAATGYLFFTHT